MRLNIVYSNLYNSAQSFRLYLNSLYLRVFCKSFYFDEYVEYFTFPHPEMIDSQLPLATSVHYTANWEKKTL